MRNWDLWWSRRYGSRPNEGSRYSLFYFLNGIIVSHALFNIYYGPFAGFALFGYGPDHRGLRTVQTQIEIIQTTETVPPIMVAAGIAVQSQWAGFPVDTLEVVEPYLSGGNTTYSQGIAQISEAELQRYVPGGHPLDPTDAIQAMAGRIQEAVAACTSCSPTDQFIIASQAQNGMGANNTKYILYNYREADGLTDWEAYFADQPLPGEGLKNVWLATRAGEGRPWAQFQLQLFTNNLQGLVQNGWQLPLGVDLDYMQCLAGGSSNCERQSIDLIY